MRGYPMDGASPKKQDYATLNKLPVHPPKHTSSEYAARSELLRLVGGAQQAVDDLMWALRGMDWNSSVKHAREALGALAEAYSKTGAMATSHPIVSTDAGDIPALSEAPAWPARLRST